MTKPFHHRYTESTEQNCGILCVLSVSVVNSQGCRRLRLIAVTTRGAICVGLALGLGPHVFSANAAPAKEIATSSLAREAMQLLKAECFSCHNEKKKKGGLVLTSRESLLTGNESGPAAEPGHQ